MSYSIIQNVVYCHPCWLFGDNATKQSIWVSGYSDWKHLTQSAIIHCNSKQHFRSDVALVQFSESKSIEAIISKQYSLEEKKWREILKLLFDVVLTLSGLGLAFRGHRENIKDARCGVYLSILKLLAKHNQVFEQHLQSSSKIKYTSKTITEEIIQILASETRNSILKKCKAAKFFTVIADSTTDISHIDQMAIMIRFVEINKEQKIVIIPERSLCFVPVKKGDASSLKDLIVNVLFKQYELNPEYLVGQAYDGAAVMSGVHGGLQKKINDYLKENCNNEKAYAPYIHCPSHQINLVLQNAAEEKSSTNVKVFFCLSPKHL